MLEDDAEETYDNEIDIDSEDAKYRNSAGRAEKSLSILTQRFVEFLQNARGGVVDLNYASP